MANRKGFLKGYTQGKRTSRIEGQLHRKIMQDLRFAFDIAISEDQFTTFYRYKIQNITSQGAIQRLISDEEGVMHIAPFFLQLDGVEDFLINEKEQRLFSWERGFKDLQEDIYINTYKATVIDSQIRDKGLYVYTLKKYNWGEEIPLEEILIMENQKSVLGIDFSITDIMYYTCNLSPHFSNFKEPLYPMYLVENLPELSEIGSFDLKAPHYTFYGAQKAWGVLNENEPKNDTISALKSNKTIVPIRLWKASEYLTSPVSNVKPWFAHLYSLGNSNQLQWRTEWFSHLWTGYGQEDPGVLPAPLPGPKVKDILIINGMPQKYPATSLSPIQTTTNEWWRLFNLFNFDPTSSGLLPDPLPGQTSIIVSTLKYNGFYKENSMYDIILGLGSFFFQDNSLLIGETTDWWGATSFPVPPALLEPVEKRNWSMSRQWQPNFPFVSTEPTDSGFQWYDAKNEEDMRYWWGIVNWPTNDNWWGAFWVWMCELMYGEVQGTDFFDDYITKSSTGEYGLELLIKAGLLASRDISAVDFEPTDLTLLQLVVAREYVDDALSFKAFEVQSTNINEIELIINYKLDNFDPTTFNIKVPTAYSVNKLATKTRIIF